MCHLNIFLSIAKGASPFYLNKLFFTARNTYVSGSHIALEIPLRKNNIELENISFIGPYNWSKLRNDLQFLNTAASFIHGYKKLVLKNLRRNQVHFLIYGQDSQKSRVGRSAK